MGRAETAVHAAAGCKEYQLPLPQQFPGSSDDRTNAAIALQDIAVIKDSIILKLLLAAEVQR
jgi:hypothetical protein